jgi:hypothetical protein
MAIKATFRFTDGMGRKTTRSWTSTATLLADAVADVAALATALQNATVGGLDGVVLSTVESGSDFVAGGSSNIDNNASVKVLAGDGYEYDFDLPMPIDGLKLAGGGFNTAAAEWTAIAALFAGGADQDWRINLRAPTTIVAATGGTIDK